MAFKRDHYMAAISANNEGVCNLKRGNPKLAHGLFVEALNSMKKVTSANRSTPSIPRPSLGPMSSPVSLKWHTITCKFKRSTTQPFMYDRAVTIESNGEAEADHVVTESAALLYNTALSSHLWGLEANQSELLQKAVRFYKIATTVVRKTPQKQSCAVLELGMINNMGLVYFEFARYKSSSLCFRHLGVQLNCIRRKHDGDGLLDMTTYNNLAMNAMIKPPSLAPAA